MMARDDPRRRSAALTLVPSERERQALAARGIAATTTGYVKASFIQRTFATLPFDNDLPVVLYAPHWQRHRSSWWPTSSWEGGADLVRRVADDGRWNLVFAPHQRLVEDAPEVRRVMDALSGRANVHCDLDSFAMVDGSYTAAVDIYLGDTSSQVVEFMARPRPCVFLNGLGADWRDDPSYAIWAGGEVVSQVDDVLPALARAAARHPQFADVQASFAAESLGSTQGAPDRAAEVIVGFLSRSGRGWARRSI
jgi:CDP-glycerol glycerophosphotransferase (TagB/SpsB family)